MCDQMEGLQVRYRQREDDAFEQLVVYIPKATARILRQKSEELGIPRSRLAAIAIDNELDATTPFHYPTPEPSNIYVEHAYANEASLLARFLGRFKQGMGLDMIMLSRRDIGIPNREELMLAVRELREADVLEEALPPKKLNYENPPSYRYLRIKGVKDTAELRRKRAELAKLQEEVEKEENILKAKQQEFMKKVGRDE